jgi:hypothetical protein
MERFSAFAFGVTATCLFKNTVQFLFIYHRVI